MWGEVNGKGQQYLKRAVEVHIWDPSIWELRLEASLGYTAISSYLG